MEHRNLEQENFGAPVGKNLRDNLFQNPYFIDGKNEAHRGEVTCTRSYRKLTAEPESPDSQFSFVLFLHCITFPQLVQSP